MRLNISSKKLIITPESHGDIAELEQMFIEDSLGLKKEGDSIKLVRRNASGMSCMAYLETKKDVNNELETPAQLIKLPEGWDSSLVCEKEIIVSHVDGSGVIIKKDSGLIIEQLFYRMMDQILKGE